MTSEHLTLIGRFRDKVKHLNDKRGIPLSEIAMQSGISPMTLKKICITPIVELKAPQDRVMDKMKAFLESTKPPPSPGKVSSEELNAAISGLKENGPKDFWYYVRQAKLLLPTGTELIVKITKP